MSGQSLIHKFKELTICQNVGIHVHAKSYIKTFEYFLNNFNFFTTLIHFDCTVNIPSFRCFLFLIISEWINLFCFKLTLVIKFTENRLLLTNPLQTKCYFRPFLSGIFFLVCTSNRKSLALFMKKKNLACIQYHINVVFLSW